MFPHERSLVKSLADRPFALVGVNSDKDPKVLAKKNAENGITWRSFWNGPAGTGGPISKQWNVSGWPTLYLLDHEGVIHKKWVGSPEEDVLDAEIEKLVELAEKAAKQDTGRAGARPFDEAVVAHAEKPQEQPRPSQVIARFDAAMKAFMKAYEEADDAGKKELYPAKYPKAEDYVEEIRAACAQTKNAEESAQGLVWLAGQERKPEAQELLVKELLDKHFESPAMADLASLLMRARFDGAPDALDRLARQSPHAAVRGSALYYQVQNDKSAFRRREATDEELKSLLAKLETIKSEYGAVAFRDSSLAQAAEKEIFELTRLRIGAIAPDIEGEDFDGVAFKLSDYRGKVVFLDFWGHW